MGQDGRTRKITQKNVEKQPNSPFWPFLAHSGAVGVEPSYKATYAVVMWFFNDKRPTQKVLAVKFKYKILLKKHATCLIKYTCSYP